MTDGNDENETEDKNKKKVKPNSKYNTYQGKSKRIKEFLGYGTKESSTETYMRSLTIFENFIKEDYESELDDLFQKLESNQLTKGGVNVDIYRFMATYLKYLIRIGNEPNTIKNRMNTAKALIITTTNPTITIDPRKYKYYVKLPKIIKKQGKGLSKETTIKLIKGSTTRPRLNTIVWFLAATSCRIGETLLLRVSDLHLDGTPHFGLRPPFLPYVSIRGETTKTGQDRIVLLTSEITEQLRLWIKERYRERNRVTITAEGKTRTVKYTPEKHPDDYLFLNVDHNYDGNDAARFVYKNLANDLRDILKNLDLTERAKNGMRLISFHKIRRGVRTRISDLGFKQSKEFADFYMGHDTSDYYYPTDDDYKRNFLLCQNELTYFDPTLVQQTYGEVNSRIDKIEDNTIVQLNKRLTEMEEREQRLLSLIVKESIAGKPAIPKENLDLIFSGELGSIPLPITNSKGEDLKEFNINRNLEVIKNNYKKESKRAKKTLRPAPKSKKIIYMLKDPPEAFKIKN